MPIVRTGEIRDPKTKMDEGKPKRKIVGAGGAVRQLREEANLSQKEFATRLRWNVAKLCKIEKNLLGLSIDAMNEISEVLETPFGAVFIRCIRELHPDLAAPGTKTGRLVELLIEAFEKRVGRPVRMRADRVSRLSRGT